MFRPGPQKITDEASILCDTSLPEVNVKSNFAMQVGRSLLFMAAIPLIPSTLPTMSAQESEKPRPWFSLTISDYRHDGLTNRLRIVVTNISDQPRHIPACGVERGFYTASVKFNGIPLRERDAIERRQREAQWRRTYCKFDVTTLNTPAGDSAEDFLSIGARYDMSNSGIYEIVLIRQTDPDHPEKSTTVQSNTLTVAVGNPPR